MCAEEEKFPPLNKEYFDEILYVVDEKYVKLNFIIEFEDISYFPYLIKKLEELSNKYKVILIDINCNGGFVSTNTHFISILRKYDVVITNNCGVAFSGGLNLWACGHFRFTNPSDLFLYHRETWGNIEKSNNHKRRAEINDLRHKLLVEKILSNILTEEEFKLGEENDVYIIGKQLIERDVAYDSKYLNCFLDKIVNLQNGKFLKLNDGYILIKEKDKFVKYKKTEEVGNVLDYLKQ